MERRGSEHRLRRVRKATGAAAVLVVSLAACGPTPTETQKPTNLSTESPNPTISVTIAPSETPMVTPSPTPEITPEPVSPITRASVLKDLEAFQSGATTALDKYKQPITLDQFKSDYNTFMKSSSATPDASIPSLFTNCLADPKQNFYLVTAACTRLTYYSLKAAEISGGDPTAVTFTKDMLSYDINTALKSDNLYLLAQFIKSQP